MSKLHIEILIQDELSSTMSTYFDGLQLQTVEGNTCRMVGNVPDYSALYGVLERIRDLNLHLVSVQVKSILPKGIAQ
jgi:hypothetical protein